MLSTESCSSVPQPQNGDFNIQPVNAQPPWTGWYFIWTRILFSIQPASSDFMADSTYDKNTALLCEDSNIASQPVAWQDSSIFLLLNILSNDIYFLLTVCCVLDVVFFPTHCFAKGLMVFSGVMNSSFIASHRTVWSAAITLAHILAHINCMHLFNVVGSYKVYTVKQHQSHDISGVMICRNQIAYSHLGYSYRYTCSWSPCWISAIKQVMLKSYLKPPNVQPANS